MRNNSTTITDVNKGVLMSKTLEWVRFPLAIAVVFIHTQPSLFFDNPSQYSLSLYSTFLTFNTLLPGIAVPAFFMISGYFFFLKDKEFTFNVYKIKICKRFKTLFIPFIVWNLFFLIYNLALYINKSDLGFYLSIKEFMSGIDWTTFFWKCKDLGSKTDWLGHTHVFYAPYLGNLWFLRDLMVMVALSPIIYFLTIHLRVYWIVICAFCYISQIWPNIPGLGITATFYFSLGAYFGIFKKNIVLEFSSVGKWILMVAFLLFISTLYYYIANPYIGNILYPLLIIVEIITFIKSSEYLVRNDKVKTYKLLSNSSFFIYCSHAFIHNAVRKAVALPIAKITDYFYYIEIFISPFITVIICVITYYLLSRYCGWLLSILTGGR